MISLTTFEIMHQAMSDAIDMIDLIHFADEAPVAFGQFYFRIEGDVVPRIEKNKDLAVYHVTQLAFVFGQEPCVVVIAYRVTDAEYFAML